MSLDLHFPPDLEKLREVWLRFAEHECGSYTPLYRQICESVSAQPEVLQLTADGPPHARQPNLLLAAVHDLILRRASSPEQLAADASLDRLAAMYSSGGGEDPGAAFVDVVLAHRDEIGVVLEQRFTQTNECGRSAPLALALSAIAAAHAASGGRPADLALIDAGCSAGLNLAVDGYRIDFGPSGSIGPVDGTLVVSELCGPNASASLALPASLDCIGWRVGLERAPVDLADDEALRWLLACLWPEHRYRLDRAVAAFEALRRDPPRIVQGDMVDDLSALIDEAPAGMLATVLTSWAAAYLRPPDRERLIDVMREASMRRPIVWLSMEAPGVVPGLDVPSFSVESATSPSLVGTIRFNRGVAEATTMGWTHPHGAWFAPA